MNTYKVLVKRDMAETWRTTDFVPRKLELIAAWDEGTQQIIYKLGDGKTPWSELPRRTDLSELDMFRVFAGLDTVEVILNPFKSAEVAQSLSQKEESTNEHVEF